jgi:hypothetical protein
MTMIDVIDELFEKLNVPKEELARLRLEATGLYVKTAEDKARITRELTDEEVERFRQLGALYLMAVVVSPEVRQKVKDYVDQQIRNN